MIEGFSIMQQILPPLDRLELVGATQSPGICVGLLPHGRFEKLRLVDCVAFPGTVTRVVIEKTDSEEEMYTLILNLTLNLSRTTFLSILHNFGAGHLSIIYPTSCLNFVLGNE